MRTSATRGSLAMVAGLGLAAVLSAAGCQSDFNGQVLPSAWWQTDDVQYFPPGSEFRLSREAAAMQAAKRNAALGPAGAAAAAQGAAGAPPQPLQVPTPLGVPMGTPPQAMPPAGEPLQ